MCEGHAIGERLSLREAVGLREVPKAKLLRWVNLTANGLRHPFVGFTRSLQQAKEHPFWGIDCLVGKGIIVVTDLPCGRIGSRRPAHEELCLRKCSSVSVEDFVLHC